MKGVTNVQSVWDTPKSAVHLSLRVADKRWIELMIARKAAEQELGAYGASSIDVLQMIRRIGFQLSSLPLEVEHPVIWGGSPTDAISRIRAYGASNGLSGVIDFAANLSELVVASRDNPLWSALVQAWDSLGKPVVLVARKQSVIGPLEELCRNLPGTPIVSSLSELPDHWDRKTTVVFGPPSLYPSWLIRFPRSDVLWVYHGWCKSVERAGPVYRSAHHVGPSVSVKLHKGASSDGYLGFQSSFEAEESDDVLIRDQIAREVESKARKDGAQTVTAWLARLANDDYVLLPVDEGTRVTVFDPREGGVRQERTRKMVDGMFVVVREKGGRDHVKALVERRFLKNPERVRTLQNVWKSVLRSRIGELGLNAVKVDIEALGVAVEPITINLWTTDLIHGPGKEDWLRVLFEYLGLGPHSETWSSVQALRRAGKQAGMYMRYELLQQTMSVDPVTVRRSATLRFEIDGVDGGALIAHKVDKIVPQDLQAPLALIGEPISGVVGQWLA